MEEVKQKEDFYLTSVPVGKLLLKFSIPCVLSMLVSALYNIVDQIFIGIKLHEAGIYATTVVYPFTVIALALALLIGDGCASLFSISLGAGDKKTSRKCVGNAMLLAVIASIILVALGAFLRNPILTLCGVTTESLTFAQQYFNIILIGIPFYVITSTLGAVIRADGSPKYSMIATIIGAVINLILDPVFILILDWGIVGAAVATIVGQIVSAIVSILYFRKPKLVKIEKDSFKLSLPMVGQIAKLGFTSLVTQVAIAVITIVANVVVRAINDPILGATGPGGALGVVFKVFGIVVAFCVGIAVGGQPIVGYNYGAKKYDRVLETYKKVILANIVVGVVATILFEACPIVFAKLFSISDYLIDFTCKCFRIYLGGILLCCIQKASCIFLQAINRPYKSMILSLMRDVIFLVPLVCILGLCFGLEEMLWAGLIADAGAFVATIIIVALEYKKIRKLSNVSLDEKNEEAITNNFVVTIEREFGSGGKYIAEQLAEKLKIKCYDNEILKELANASGFDEKHLELLDEAEKDSYWYSYAQNTCFDKDGKMLPINGDDALFLKQSKLIEDFANNESCVVVGRCSSVVLAKHKNVFSFFVYSSDDEFKINRKMKFEGLSREEAIKKIKKVNKNRSNYFKKYTGSEWGSPKNYELMIDTSKVGVDKAVDILYKYVNERIK